MTVSLLVAMGKNGVIGRNKQLPWQLPEDLKHFKSLTLGHPIIMGRKTFESIGRVLPGRASIIVSQSGDFRVHGAIVVGSLEEALCQAKRLDPSGEHFVIGGAEIFKLALPVADRLYITLIDRDFEGDTVFPDLHWERHFEIVEDSGLLVSAQEKIPYRFLVAERKSSYTERLN